VSPDELGSKRCRDCGVEKPLTDFWLRKASPDGRSLYCAPCFKQRNQASDARRAEREGREFFPRASSTMDLPDGKKYCPRCQQVLSIDDFVRNRSSATGIGTYCRPCQRAKSAESIARVHGTTRHYHLMQRYGIGALEVEQMLEAQGWACLICSATLTAKTAHVDHDHATGSIRGILCFNCNGGLGQFRDDVQCLRRAVTYLSEGAAALTAESANDDVTRSPLRAELGSDTPSLIELAWQERFSQTEFGTAS
jgi:Recombination endonuclease VII